MNHRRGSSGSPSPSGSSGSLQPTQIWWILCLVAISLVLSFFGIDLWLRRGNSPILLPVWGFVLPLLVGIFVLWQGWRVRAYKRGKSALEALAAARIWVLTQATSRAGAVLTGFSFGVVLAYAHLNPTAFTTDQIRNFSLAGLGWIALTVGALVAERWCVVDDDGGDGDATPGGSLNAAQG
ncbi:DUF3180 domain-containing protein [Arcanobacterium bovis]|uniref:DUF3180 domain-containing protein n=1 Tax=Arcanobacterium bovis TaxID=2529275 RepID=A0A4Q9UZN5_9ACTO|nr:DUF3180 domain-containing protein [Arcanobacterium bovis]TBW21489.1 DUF3180 domain-containing protein [Arcanobacterium bovis]